MSVHEDRKVLLKGFFINLSGNISRLFRPLFILLITRLYSTEVFGAFSVVLAFIEFLHSISLLGMEDATYKFVPERMLKGRGLKKALFTLIFTPLIISVILTAGFYLLLPLFASVYIQEAEVKLAFVWMLPLVITLTLSRIFLAQTRALKKMEYYVFTVDFLEPLGMTVFLLLFHFIPQTSHIAPYIAYLCATSVSAILGFYFFKTRFPSLKDADQKVGYDKEIVKYAVFMGGNSLIGGGLRKIDIMLAGYFLSPAKVGIYSLAVEIAYTLGKIRTALNPVLSPLSSELHANGQKERFSKTFEHSIHLTLLFSTPALVVFLFAGKDLLRFFGPQYVDAYIPLVLLASSHFVNNALGQVFQIVAIVGKPFYSFLAAMYDLFVRAVLAFVLIPIYGISGAALSTAFGTATCKLPLIVYLIKNGIVTWHLRLLNVAIKGFALGGACYLVFYWLVDGLPYYLRFILFTATFVALFFLTSYNRSRDRSRRA